MTYPNCFNR